jgi:hypothetical protein
MKRLAILCAWAALCAGLIATCAWWAVPTDHSADAAGGLDFGAGASGPAQPPPRSLPAAAVVNARYRLEAVEPDAAGESDGLARIAVDGGAARDFHVAESVASGLVLLGVSPGGAILGPPGGPPMVVLEAVAGATATRPAQDAGQRQSSTVASGLQPVPAADLLPDALAAALPNSGRPAPGRRERLQHSKPGP